MQMIEQLKAARQAATPQILIRTMDNESAQYEIGDAFKDEPLVMWDAGRGMRAVNSPGIASLRATGLKGEDLTQAVDALRAAEKLADRTILFFHNPQLFLSQQTNETGELIQVIRNLREPFKDKQCQWLGLGGPWSVLPPEIKGDVFVIDEPMPDDAALAAVVLRVHEGARKGGAKLADPSKQALQRAVDALRGLSDFAAEQATSMSLALNDKGQWVLNMEGLWERKRKMIETQKGLSIWRGKESLDQVFGMDNLINYVKPLLPHVSVVLYMDEIEDMMAGVEGDTSGVAQALHQYLLTYMSDREVLAVLMVGPPGTGKSFFAKAVGNYAGIPTISLDTNGMKGGIVGESEGNTRAAFSVIDAVGQGRILLLATCNSVEKLSPQLQSRFLDTFYVKLPEKDARTAMWQQYGREFGVKDQAIPEDEGWAGREIKGCCRKAALRKTDLKEAAQYVVPISVKAAEKITSLGERSSGRFLDASKPGLYQYEMKERGRAMRAISLPLVGNN